MLLTFVYVVRSLRDDGNEIWIDVLVQNGSIVEHSALRMDVFVGIFRSDFNDFL